MDEWEKYQEQFLRCACKTAFYELRKQEECPLHNWAIYDYGRYVNTIGPLTDVVAPKSNTTPPRVMGPVELIVGLEESRFMADVDWVRLLNWVEILAEFGAI
ncbi:hypothetical protein BY996DRAFT_6485554 [Phakopsora pachyrhizi]|nr:hypothetical protein BY996DRAFT_6485554 [Phakopsora pachyrhizi]